MNLPRMKDTGILLGWLAGLLLIGGLLWSLTEGVRNRGLQRAVNRLIADAGINEPLQLNGVISGGPGKRMPLGTWFSADGAEDRVLVFPLISGGAALPCAAVVNPRGKVERIIPLGLHGEQVFKHLSQGILRVYIHRIEAELAPREKEQK
ncbi:hypothetical protein AGMMS49546_25670 [Spirochaetia bacterium]|nr:hypothetical protein AGMMS49546_25670 [Spirochaetia bacterium]